MRVKELWRYPVKSLQGERLREALVTTDGLDGDRRYAIFDLATGLGLTARRVPELLFASASLTADGVARITLPDGSVADGDDALSDWLGRRVALRSADEDAGRRYEDVVDFEREHSSAWRAFEGAPGPFHDSSRARVSLVSTQTIAAWDRRRFRANALLEGAGEDALIGSSVSLGEAVLDIGGKIQRCVMVTRPQPGGSPATLASCVRSRASDPRASRSARSSPAQASCATPTRCDGHSRNRCLACTNLEESRGQHALRAGMWPSRSACL